MNAETTNNGHNTTAGDVPDLSREGDNDKLSQRSTRPDQGDAPKLTEMFEKKARSDSSIEWAKGFFEHIEPGMLHMDQRGFVLQVLHPNTIRVVQVFEALECFSSLSMALESLTAAGIEVELDGFAFITTPPLESGPAEEVGVPRDDAPDASLESMLDLTEGIGMEDSEPGHHRLGGAESPRSGDVVLMSPCNCEFCFHGIDHRETKWCFPIGEQL